MRILHCMNMLDSCLGVDGDVVECGVASGANTFPLADMVKTYNKENGTRKRVFACDTFSGLPYDDVFASGHKAGEFNFGLNFKLIQEQRKDLPVVRIEGLIEETLPRDLSHGQFCFVFLDMDLYEPTKIALEFFKTRLSVGGIIALHDFEWMRCEGIEKAVGETLEITKYRQELKKDYTVFYRKFK